LPRVTQETGLHSEDISQILTCPEVDIAATFCKAQAINLVQYGHVASHVRLQIMNHQMSEWVVSGDSAFTEPGVSEKP